MKRTETLTILSFFIIASLMMVGPQAFADDNWYGYYTTNDSITIEFLVETDDGYIHISIADPDQGCGEGTEIHNEDIFNNDPQTYTIQSGIKYYVIVEAWNKAENTEYTDNFCFDVSDDVDFSISNNSITANVRDDPSFNRFIYQIYEINDCHDSGTILESATTPDFKYIFESLDQDTLYKINIVIFSDHGTIQVSQCMKTSDKLIVKKSGGGCSDCIPPTIGMNSQGERFVECGIRLNGNCLNVDYFKTHMPMQYTEIGKQNLAEFKVYENNGAYNIDMFQMGFGVKEIGTPLSESQVLLEINIKNFASDIENPSLNDIVLRDRDGIIKNYKVDTYLTPCMSSAEYECLKLDIYWTYDKVPTYPVLSVNMWDNKKNVNTDYFNDGLTVIDPNYVEPVTPEPHKYVCNDKPLDEIMNGGDRNNCHFRAQLISMWK